jgi:hypothetical protein
LQRAIVGFHQDDEGEWVAELVCPDCGVFSTAVLTARAAGV